MGRRSTFRRRPHDNYVTPEIALAPLIPHLPKVARFVEPCAGNGALVRHLTNRGHRCLYSCDIKPRHDSVRKRDALTLDRDWRERMLAKSDGRLMIISNPPWTKEIKCALIEHLSKLLPTWLLMDADFMHTTMAADLLDHCDKIVSVGRVKWFPRSEFTSKDSVCWYHFNRRHHGGPQFYGRIAT